MDIENMTLDQILRSLPDEEDPVINDVDVPQGLVNFGATMKRGKDRKREELVLPPSED